MSVLLRFAVGVVPEALSRTHNEADAEAQIDEATNDRFAPIVLKKSSLTAERNFSGPPVRPSCGDVRDHIASHKNDHRLSYRSWRGCSGGAY
jgi:hypothetical protein